MCDSLDSLRTSSPAYGLLDEILSQPRREACMPPVGSGGDSRNAFRGRDKFSSSD